MTACEFWPKTRNEGLVKGILLNPKTCSISQRSKTWVACSGRNQAILKGKINEACGIDRMQCKSELVIH